MKTEHIFEQYETIDHRQIVEVRDVEANDSRLQEGTRLWFTVGRLVIQGVITNPADLATAEPVLPMADLVVSDHKLGLLYDVSAQKIRYIRAFSRADYGLPGFKPHQVSSRYIPGPAMTFGPYVWLSLSAQAQAPVVE